MLRQHRSIDLTILLTAPSGMARSGMCWNTYLFSDSATAATLDAYDTAPPAAFSSVLDLHEHIFCALSRHHTFVHTWVRGNNIASFFESVILPQIFVIPSAQGSSSQIYMPQVGRQAGRSSIPSHIRSILNVQPQRPAFVGQAVSECLTALSIMYLKMGTNRCCIKSLGSSTQPD